MIIEYMETLDQIPPVKKAERTHLQRQFLRWNKYWYNCKDPKKREKWFDEAVKLGQWVEDELFGKQRGY